MVGGLEGYYFIRKCGLQRKAANHSPRHGVLIRIRSPVPIIWVAMLSECIFEGTTISRAGAELLEGLSVELEVRELS